MNLTPYQQILSWYLKYQEAYHWTVRDIDQTDALTLIDQLKVAMLTNQPQKAYIEEVLPLA